MDEPQRHAVVFDCNVYLDVAELIGPPFSWRAFNALSVQSSQDAVPHPTTRALDSLRSLAVCMSGRFAGEEVLEVWTNAHIDKIVRGKALASIDPDSAGNRGLGWSKDEAQGLVDVMIADLISRSGGGTLGDTMPNGNPPLDHEDGMVFGACRELVTADLLRQVYCITNDKAFIQTADDGDLGDHTIVMSPSRFIQLVRLARSRYSIRRMRGHG